jgi:hypothetical protein
MTDTMTSHNIDLTFWDIVYITYVHKKVKMEYRK